MKSIEKDYIQENANFNKIENLTIDDETDQVEIKNEEEESEDE